MKWFQAMLNRFKLSHLVLHKFVESFNGYYKDGTEPETKDCRYFASLFLLLRIISYIALGCTENIASVIFFSFASTLFAMLFIVCKPYKAQYSVYNSVAVVLLLAGCALVTCFLGLFVSEIIADQAHTLATLSLLFAFIPLFYLTGLTTKWVWRHNPVTQYCCRYIIRIRDVERS